VLLSSLPASKCIVGSKKTFLCKSNKCLVGFVLLKMDFRMRGEI